MRRRTFLGGVANCSLAATLGGCSYGFQNHQPSGDWEQQADRGIRNHRTTDLTVRVVDLAGEPVSDAAVSVSMTDHDFSFGTAVRSNWVAGAGQPPDPYLPTLLENFNTAVLEGRHKWQSWEVESERAIADQATRWLLENGLDVRGHTLVWQALEHEVLPADVVAKLRSNDDDRPTYLDARVTEHIRNIVSHYDGLISEWDFLNEHLDHHRITEAIDPDTPPQESTILQEWLETATDAAGSGTDFYVNETGVLTTDVDERHEQLERLLDRLQGGEATIAGVGMQGHFGSRESAVTPEGLRGDLDRYADLGVDIKITEYDTFGSGWTERAEADHLEAVLKTLFSHPAATGFLMWGFWDSVHWESNAPFFREDWSPKPAYDVYSNLVFDEWWTDESGRTDEDGTYRTRAFYGDYEIRAEHGDRSGTVRWSLNRSGSDDTLTLRIG